MAIRSDRVVLSSVSGGCIEDDLIDSKMPYEIAISILAELTAVKNAVMLPEKMSVETGKTSRASVPVISH